MSPQIDKQNKIDAFDPNGVGLASQGIFGLPFTCEESQVVIFPMPWEVTVSFRGGTSKAPQNILQYGSQIDLYHHAFPELWKVGIAIDELSAEWTQKGIALKKLASEYITSLEQGNKPKQADDTLKQINDESEAFISWATTKISRWLDKKKIVGLLGGDHSTSIAAIRALNQQTEFGILQIDAHMDLRTAYEGFVHSHASIMYNALQLENITKLVQVGVRDYCEEEVTFAKSQVDRIQVFSSYELKKQLFEGKTWSQICDQIVDALPRNIYLSFDIDGLTPDLCPNTGTPVAGGLDLERIEYLLSKIVASKKSIVGFDLVEVGDHELDSIIASKLLYTLCGYTVLSQ